LKKRIYNTGRHLPKPKISDWFELQSKRNQLVTKPIMQQSRRDKTIIYGGHALNRLMGRGFKRDTYDYDIYSSHPLKHALEIEQSIDRGTNSDLAFVERTFYPDRGTNKILHRVKIRLNDTVEADFNRIPLGIRVVKRNGVLYEGLKDAESKYKRMNKQGVGRTGFGEIDRIRTYKLLKKKRR